MSKYDEARKKKAMPVKSTAKASSASKPVSSSKPQPVLSSDPKLTNPEELRKIATEYLAKADRIEEARAREAEAKEREAKAKEELEREKSFRRVYFTHNADGTIDYSCPFFNANDARYYDHNYVVVPSLVQDGKYIRPLTKDEACLIR